MRSLCLTALLLALASPVRAQVVPGGGDVPPVSGAPPGEDSVKRGVQGPAGLFHSRILLHINTSKNHGAEPISLAPDLYYAVNDSVQIGLLHNLPMGWLTRPGAGFCLTGKNNGCPHVYDNVGFDLLWGLLFGDVNLSLHSSFYLMRIADPLLAMITVGTAAKFHFGDAVALFFDPQFGFALNDRNVNKDQFYLPAELQFQIVPPVAFKLLFGLTGPLSNFGDNYVIPVGIGVIGNLSSAVDLGLRFSFDNLLGHIPPGETRTSVSSLSVLMHLRF
jgi:hypothetical protein